MDREGVDEVVDGILEMSVDANKWLGFFGIPT